MSFTDRRDAGRRLAARLAPLAGERPIVVALPRGGVPVAVEVAQALRAPLDVLAVGKLGAPGNPEFGVGAVAEDGIGVLDADSARRAGMTQRLYERTLARESQELRRRVRAYRDGRPAVDVRGHTVVVVDDGLATGLTDLAAVRVLRHRGAARIVVAAPVGSAEAVALLETEADDVVCVAVPPDFGGVGRWYEDFEAVPDDVVVALLGGGVPSRSSSERTFVLDGVTLHGDLCVPPGADGLVIFAHGSGSDRQTPRNQVVARALEDAGFATLLFDLLSPEEEARREADVDVRLPAARLEHVAALMLEDPATVGLPIGFFGASTGAAAAMRAAGELGPAVRAVVSRGGRPDLAGARLSAVTAPTLLIVGGADREGLELNRAAAATLQCPHRIAIVRGAGRRFTEVGALEAVARLTRGWFQTFLPVGDPSLAASRS